METTQINFLKKKIKDIIGENVLSDFTEWLQMIDLFKF